MKESVLKLRENLNTSMGLPGPLVILIGAMHGNEKAGVDAIFQTGMMLLHEPQKNPSFLMHGRVVGLIGNLSAYLDEKRFIDQDLNRIWHKANDTDVRALKNRFVEDGVLRNDLTSPHELQELAELKNHLLKLIKTHPHNEVLILDLHTTSADGGIFSISLDGNREEAIARTLHAPMVKGLLNGISGTLLHWIKSLKIKDKRITGLAFESGMHTDPLSVDRAISAIIHALRGMGCIDALDVESKHQDLLVQHSENLPEVVELRYVHKIAPESGFVMRPGYVNFQPIIEGEHLADDAHGAVLAPCGGLILMPLYQKLGVDGFFLVEVV
jgi:succinylglutamate desuccinylase